MKLKLEEMKQVGRAKRWCKETFGFLSFAKPRYDDKSLATVERILVIKSWALMSVRLVLVVINLSSKNYFIKQAKLIREDDNHADINLDF